MSINLFYKYAATIAIVFFIQFQFGCSLDRFTASNNNSNINSPAIGNSPVEAKPENVENLVPEICRNAYYPFGPNVERKYQVNYGKNAFPTQNYTERYTNFSGDEFTSNTEFKTVSSTVNWRCTPEGLLATQYGNSVDMKSAGSAKIDTLKSSGVSFVAEPRWNTGEKWTTDYDIKQTIADATGQTTGEGNGNIKQIGEIIGEEQITVPAGTFQTKKIKLKTNVDLIVKVGGASAPAKTTLETTAWFAKDVGMVKSETAMGPLGNATTELLSYAGTK